MADRLSHAKAAGTAPGPDGSGRQPRQDLVRNAVGRGRSRRHDAAGFPLKATAAAAGSATSVVPKPVSPHTSLSIAFPLSKVAQHVIDRGRLIDGFGGGKPADEGGLGLAPGYDRVGLDGGSGQRHLHQSRSLSDLHLEQSAIYVSRRQALHVRLRREHQHLAPVIARGQSSEHRQTPPLALPRGRSVIVGQTVPRREDEHLPRRRRAINRKSGAGRVRTRWECHALNSREQITLGRRPARPACDASPPAPSAA
ncbi:hypothetical protein KKHFBJBL_01782 [Brevundimonas sp. NIBR11]|nr:hypothetical protein KKHFBJBL_01782 [Brevundimonas sp. NIBR11]